MRRLFARSLAVLVLAMAGACGQETARAPEGDGHAEEEAFERGPHRGRMLRSGDFAVEITIFETGVPPEFHVYAYDNGKPVAPSKVGLSIQLKRLGGKVDRFAFAPEGDYLRGDATVEEPHSFDVSVAAQYAGKRHAWAYASYEGRTTISPAAAREGGVVIEKTGPATIKLTVELLGHADLAPGAKADLRARFPGRVLSVNKSTGDAVKSGETLARIESNESLQSYSIVSPLDGVVMERNINAGDVTGEGVVFVVGATSHLAANFHVFDRDAARLKPGQEVSIVSLDGSARIESTLTSLSPAKDPASQSITARALFEDGEHRFRPGMTVRGLVVVDKAEVELAVKTEGIQLFRDMEVVYQKIGDTYEVRMVETGRRTADWTEVKGGIDPGADYVTGGSFLIKADIEKSGASHDH